MLANDHMQDQNEIQARLKEAHEECQRLREENDRLRSMLGISHPTPDQVSQISLDPKSPRLAPSEVYTPERKIALFRNLFRGRDDVFAVRWEGKGGKTGYLPAGEMDWHAIHAA